ncbi:MAG: response regulator transcription factor [Afipia sp.]|nr:response regulator transcription factor [Afipia sp.]
MKILLVEDDPALGKAIAERLRKEGFAVDLAVNGEDGSHLGASEIYDAAILDLGLPKQDGISVLREWRKLKRTLPVLVLTARDDWTSKVEGFKAGADDYLVKPVRIEELIMRLRALGRRSAGQVTTLIECGSLSFDSQLGAFSLDGLPLKLTALELRVLSCLILRKGVIVRREDLFERVYESEGGADSNSLEVIVGRLRRKIGAKRIETSRGLGYRLVCDDK